MSHPRLTRAGAGRPSSLAFLAAPVLLVSLALAAACVGAFVGGAAPRARAASPPAVAPAAPPAAPSARRAPASPARSPAPLSLAPGQAGPGADDEVLLPVLSTGGPSLPCLAWLSVQNVGAEPSLGMLVGFPGGSDCAESAIPITLQCTGLMRPGRAWSMIGAQLPGDVASGAFYSLSAAAVSEILPQVDDDGLVGDRICQELADRANLESYLAFQRAYRQGAVFAGLPMDAARGAAVTVRVLRTCPGSFLPGARATGSYTAPSARGLGAWDPARGEQRYRVDPALAGASGRSEMLFLQNAGASCANVTLRVDRQGGCGETEVCRQLAVGPGRAAALDLAACAGETPATGYLLLSDQPLSVALDSTGRDDLGTQLGRRLAAPGGTAEAGATSLVLPTFFGEAGGAPVSSTVTVRNLAGDRAARVELSVLDAQGVLLDRQTAEICAGGSHRFSSAAARGAGAEDHGLLRVRSQALSAASDDLHDGARDRARDRARDSARDPARDGAAQAAAPIQAVLGWADEAGTGQAFAQALLPDPRSGEGAGRGLLSVHPLAEDPEGLGTVSDLLLGNAAEAEGRTEAAVMVFDVNGLVDTLCVSLGPGASARIALTERPALASGFAGALLVSATSWTHEQGRELGLAAVLVERMTTERGDTSGGDALGLSAATPLGAEAAGWLTGWLTQAPRCPDLPARSPLGGGPPESWPAAARAAELHAPSLVQVAALPPDPDATPRRPRYGLCAARLEVRNAGDAAAQLLLVAQGEPNYCPPEQESPLAIACSGLVAPGEDWTFAPGTLNDAYAADVYSLTPASLDELGLRPGDQRPAAEAICARLQDTGGAADLRAFRLAFRRGTRFDGLPLDRLYGGAIRAEVLRDCAWPDAEVAGVAAAYAARTHAEAVDPRAREAGDGFVYAVPRYFVEREGLTTALTIQNVGDLCANVWLRFADVGGETRPRSCQILALPPAESFDLDWRWCVEPGVLTEAVIESDQPLAIVAEDIDVDSAPPELNPFPVYAGANAFDFDADGDVDPDDLALLEAGLGSRRDDEAWNGRLDVWPDGVVDPEDRSWFLLHMSGAAPTPGPPATPTTPPPTMETPAPATPTAPAGSPLLLPFAARS